MLIAGIILASSATAATAHPTPAAPAAASQPENNSDHFWRKRKIQETSRRIIEIDLGVTDKLTLDENDHSQAGNIYRFTWRLPAGKTSAAGYQAYAIQGDVAHGAILSIRCQRANGSIEKCYPR
ncbi:hypothetical protein [Chromobacterium sp. IIBBL 290-4]|uniref:hypothetical protein n=1 Tax=Chromobacterium sp. IIBBL 290-4 TaxID=2953890 RepID=UPI0020B6B57A|nr:hypothetical protein [Chromobacterium sp. IIBBL 290-4]UTH74762.1 hypothetical protein NKT35_01220 [Chromobacterium sp. IIBBL 290-4]